MNKANPDLPNGFSSDIHTRKTSEVFVMNDHSHKYHEFYFLLEGTAKYFINNEIITVDSHEVAFVKKGYIHKATYDYGCSSKRLLVNFTSEFIGEQYLGLLKELGKKKLIVFESDTREKISAIFQEIYTEYTSKQENYLSQCKNLLRELVIILCRQQPPKIAEKLSDNEILIENAAKYISANLNEDITLAKLAEMYAMSESHFSRTFKQYAGIGVSKYIKLLRLRQAEKLLVLDKYSITEIAIKCGFNNSNYFISEFKKHRGVTPYKYATTNREG